MINPIMDGADTGKPPTQMIMYSLLYLLFVACLALVSVCIDLVRWPISKFQLALLSMRREFSLAVEQAGKKPR